MTNNGWHRIKDDTVHRGQRLTGTSTGTGLLIGAVTTVIVAVTHPRTGNTRAVTGALKLRVCTNYNIPEKNMVQHHRHGGDTLDINWSELVVLAVAPKKWVIAEHCGVMWTVPRHLYKVGNKTYVFRIPDSTGVHRCRLHSRLRGHTGSLCLYTFHYHIETGCGDMFLKSSDVSI